MPAFPIPKILRLFAKVAAVYAAVFILWIFAAQNYHLLLGRAAGQLIPLVINSTVKRVWYDRGVRYEIEFQNSENSRTFAATGVVDTLHFGYPLITFLVLALALPGPPWRRRILLSTFGVAILFAAYSILILIAVCEFLGQYDVAFLRENLIVRLLPPAFYTRYEIPFLIFLGQVLPISVYGLLFFRPILKAKRKITL